MSANIARQLPLWGHADKLSDDFQDLQRMVPSQETNYATHNLHDYPARFIPHFPRIFIDNLTRENDLVVDPMVGGGTTVIEAALLKRRGYGIDIDPIAVLTSKVATTPINSKKLRAATRGLLEQIHKYFDEGWRKAILPTDAEYPNHSIWFREETLKQLIFLRDMIRNIPSREIRDLSFLALSSITREVSNADPRDIFPQRDQNELVRPKQDVLRVFSNALNRIQEKVVSFSQITNNKKLVEIISGDARKIMLQSATVDLILTSPPYAYAIDYARVNQLSTLLFIMSNAELRDYRKKYIGTDRVAFAGDNEKYECFKFAKEDLEKIQQKDKKSGAILYQYFTDMATVTKECYRILKRKKRLVYVIGNSTIKGSPFSTEDVFMEISKEIGFTLEKKYLRPYYSYRMSTKRNVHSNSIKEDIFLILRKP